MNISAEIKSKYPNANQEHLDMYVAICESPSAKGERHHILPQKMWPEYADFNIHQWNKVVLRPKHHLLAHYYLALATNDGAAWAAVHGMFADKHGNRTLDYTDIENLAEIHGRARERAYKHIGKLASARMKGKTGKDTPRFGTITSDIGRRRISEGRKGIKHSKETKLLFSQKFKGEGNSFYGRNHTEESKRLIGDKNKGHRCSQENKDKLSKLWTGKPKSEETKRRMSKPKSEEHKAALSKAKARKTLVWERELYTQLKDIWMNAAESGNQMKRGKFLTHLESIGITGLTGSQIRPLVEHFFDVKAGIEPLHYE